MTVPALANSFVFFVLAAMLLGGCQPQSIEVEAVGSPLRADDGHPLMVFRFAQKRTEKRPPRAVVLYVQGSEPRSVTEHIGMLAGFCAMNATVIGVERRGVRPDRPADMVAFNIGATRELRIADHLSALTWGLEGVAADVPVIILGASEGADVGAAVAARSGRVTHVILLGGGGGWTQEEEFRHFIRTRGKYLDLASERDLDLRVADIKAHPDAETLWAGLPYRRWSSFMFTRPADDLLKTERPILVVQGAADDSVPIESARDLKARFDRAGKTNLTLVEIPDADHGFNDPKRSIDKRPLVEIAIVDWLARQGAIAPAEAAAYSARVQKAHPELFRPDAPDKK